MLKHLAAGGDAIVLSEGDIVHRRETTEQRIASAAELPMTVGGLATFNVDNALAVVAACLAAGLEHDFVSAAIATFTPDATSNPARLNLFESGGVTVIVDYAHNPESYRELFAFSRQITSGRLIGLVSAPGDRRDADLMEVGRTCVPLLDEMIVYEMSDRRGRRPGESVELIAAGARAEPEKVTTVLRVEDAVRFAFDRCVAGDTLIVGCASSVADLGDLRAELSPLVPSQVFPRAAAEFGHGPSVSTARVA